MEEILKIVESIPIILEYFVPGFVFLVIIDKMIGVKFNRQTNELIFSVIISVVIKSGLVFCHGFVFKNWHPASEASFFICTVTGAVIALMVSLLYRSKKVSGAFSAVFVKSLHDNIWEDVVDFRQGTGLRITMKSGEVIIGGFYEIEEKGNDSWLALNNYVYGDQSFDDFVEDGLDSLLMIRLADVDRVQLFTKEDKD